MSQLPLIASMVANALLLLFAASSLYDMSKLRLCTAELATKTLPPPPPPRPPPPAARHPPGLPHPPPLARRPEDSDSSSGSASAFKGCGKESGANCENSHAVEGMDVAGCTSHFLCAMTPVTRANLVHATTYHQKRMLPELGGSESLLVPIRKPLRWTPELADEELVLPPWPQRSDARINMAWDWLPEGDYFRRCGGQHRRMHEHIYCKYFATKKMVSFPDPDHYLKPGRVAQWPHSASCASHHAHHMLVRPDVRLILDISGGNGQFAKHVLSCYGSSKVTVVSNLVLDERNGRVPPFSQAIAAWGFPTVAMDMYSFFPFAESTYDAIHTEWTYHTGYPRVTLMEMYRVLRPGGFLSLTTWKAHAGAKGHARVRAFAKEMGWRLISGGASGMKNRSEHVTYQMPSYRYNGL